MARKEISWEYPMEGEDSYDSQTDIPSKFCKRLSNLIPRGNKLEPRKGIYSIGVSIPGAVWACPAPWTNGWVVKAGYDLWFVSASGSALSIKEGCFVSDKPNVASAVVGDVLIINSSDAGFRPLSIRYVDNVFVADTVNLNRASELRIEAVEPVVDPSETPVMKYYGFARGYAVTQVRLDSDGEQRVYDDARAESWEDITMRLVEYIPRLRGTTEEAVLRLKITAGEKPEGTHIRVWCTAGIEGNKASDEDSEYDVLEGTSLSIATGLKYRWMCDVPINQMDDTNTIYVDLNLTEGTITGETHVLDTTGLNEMPSGDKMLFTNGRLWVGGVSDQSPGRVFYSSPMSGTRHPIRMLSLFNYSDNYSDTSIADSESISAMGVSNGNIIVICSNDTWVIPSGSVDAEPQKISDGLGSRFNNLIASNGTNILAMTSRGPAMVTGGSIDLMQDWRIAEIWPDSVTSIHSLDASDKRRVTSTLFGDHWIIANGSEAYVYTFRPNGGGGGWRIIPAESSIDFRVICANSFNTCLLISSDGQCYQLMYGMKDGSSNYIAECEFAPKFLHKSRAKVGDLYDMKAYARWNDSGELRFTVTTDMGRHIGSYSYEQRPVTASLQNTDVSNSYRNVVQQGAREGYCGSLFSLKISKRVYSNNFVLEGASISVIERDGHPYEYISVSDPETTEIDSGVFVFDWNFMEA